MEHLIKMTILQEPWQIVGLILLILSLIVILKRAVILIVLARSLRLSKLRQVLTFQETQTDSGQEFQDLSVKGSKSWADEEIGGYVEELAKDWHLPGDMKRSYDMAVYGLPPPPLVNVNSDDGIKHTFQVSEDGINWRDIESEDTPDWLKDSTTQEDSPKVGSTGCVPGGVSFVGRPQYMVAPRRVGKTTVIERVKNAIFRN